MQDQLGVFGPPREGEEREEGEREGAGLGVAEEEGGETGEALHHSI